MARADGWNIFFNQQWVEYTGLSLEESYGHGWIKPFHPEERQWVWDAWQYAIKADSIFSLECRLLRADGIYRWWLVRGVSRHDEKGKIINWFGTCTDISEQKKTEEKLLESLRKLEEKERSTTRFLAAAGHDLRQPVAAANLFVFALKQTHPTPHQRELIEKLGQSMDAFADLLKQLLDISKFDAGLIKPQNTTFNLTELSLWLEQTFTQTAMNHGLKFQHYFSSTRSLLVCTDIGLLRSVLMNLVSNAIKFTSRGGILISARPRQDSVLIQIWDTGIGISEVHIQHIFDEFYQIANQSHNREVGLGLGLSICQRAISLLGGKITCRSRLGYGSIFEFSLKLAEDKRHIVRKREDEAPRDIACEIFTPDTQVTIVEDDELIACGMISLLEGFGAKVHHFRTAEDALRYDDIAGIKYYIVDYTLSGELTGLDFLKSLQQRQIAPIRAVIVTGETSSRFISSVANCPWPLLHKPVDFEKLALALYSAF
jgi:PAS domain S-box-containing protein